MYTSTLIRRHIYSLPKGKIFSTRDMLNYGRRSAIDQCLYRLVKAGRIIRLAWGLFIREDSETDLPSPRQVAMEKARAFCKTIFTDAQDATKLLGLTAFGNERLTYAIQGHSSSFNYRETRIYLKGVCQRKISLGDDPISLAAKALWIIGKKHCDQRTIEKATARFKRQERLQFRQSCHLMPSWLTNIFMK
jgi:hypothetical protein